MTSTTMLVRGANVSLQDAVLDEHSCLTLRLQWAAASDLAPMPMAFLLTASGKVRTDSDLIFANHPRSEEGGVSMPASELEGVLHQQDFEIELNRLPPGIVRVAVALAATPEVGKVALAAVQPIVLQVIGARTGRVLAETRIEAAGAAESALIVGELYLRQAEWKFKSIGQGFEAGITALAAFHGVTVAEEAQAHDGPSRVDTPPVAGAASFSIAPPQIFTPPGPGFGEIQIGLNWNALPPQDPQTLPAKKGFLSGLLGAKGPAPLDLDLCCLYELTDGYRGVVQALGGNFGSFSVAPFVRLMGDEKQAGSTSGELMRLNGARWGEIRSILFYAMIFDGPANWAQAGARATVRVPDEVPVSVKLDLNVTDRRACTIALLENKRGSLVLQKRIEAFKNPREIDQHYGWGLRWSAGAKG